MRGETTIGMVVAETTEAIWTSLHRTWLPVPDTNKWKNISARYEQLWILPHCVGLIDGKHIRVKKFGNTGSQNFNYKGYFLIQLMACADEDGCLLLMLGILVGIAMEVFFVHPV